MALDVAATFCRTCRFRLWNPNPLVVDIKYVEGLKEIVELNYKGSCMIVLVCIWVKPNNREIMQISKKISGDLS